MSYKKKIGGTLHNNLLKNEILLIKKNYQLNLNSVLKMPMIKEEEEEEQETKEVVTPSEMEEMSDSDSEKAKEEVDMEVHKELTKTL